MIIGIMSDSHGRARTTEIAVRAVCDAGAETIIHLGDLETPEVLEALAVCPAEVVLGNCDFDAAGLRARAGTLGVRLHDQGGRLEIDGKRIAFTHGHLPRVMREAFADRVDYLLHGHTHEIRDERIGPTRVINPGALFRAVRYTAAILDPAKDRLEILDLRDLL